jgi:hypothetical protein
MSVKQPRTRKFMAHEPGFTIIDAMNRLFPVWFDGESRDVWRVILKAAFALPVTKDEVAFFRTIAGDRDPPKKRSVTSRSGASPSEWGLPLHRPTSEPAV